MSICIIPITETYLSYAQEVGTYFPNARIDGSDHTTSQKIINATSYDYLFLIGRREFQQRSVTVYSKHGISGLQTIDNILSFLQNKL